jgi:hypothetical protein
MTRQERFELEYADQNNMRPEDFVQYRMGDTYRLPAIARAHRYFCWGWDSAISEEGMQTIEIPELLRFRVTE